MYKVIKTTKMETPHGFFCITTVFGSEMARVIKVLVFILVIWILTNVGCSLQFSCSAEILESLGRRSQVFIHEWRESGYKRLTQFGLDYAD